MGIETRAPLQHWNYFLSIEDDVARLARYVEPTESNFACHSIELARVLFAAASEVDVVLKQLCEKLDPNCRASSINTYRSVIFSTFPGLESYVVTVPRFGLTLTPWESWHEGSSPLWWTAYNKVKHRRHTHFEEACLKHALNGVAALFLVLLLFYREEAMGGLLSPDPSLFCAGPPFFVDRHVWGDQGKTYRIIGKT
ncbi:hypothetical protein VVD49_05610 [Uliginosibacterium sp. H3]|uniref:Uncharacterized protein n=1 Tax=Uliginosibacterium silvisoli TaxID=3114758 RepID=A0ABU6K1V2_9RHOO|nr:hypothetical protein [Uliginosibacterium sp. H3]